MKPQRQPLLLAFLRTAGLIAIALFQILVLFPAALAAQASRTS
jgi:hypothetical protein